jgi:hypothetical protein
MMKILITGGPVHAYLDDVKIITNKFKGGLMADLANKFIKHNEQNIEEEDKVHVTYICSKDSKRPIEDSPYCEVMCHNGINDYMVKVQNMATRVDAVVLGAAVANLIPKEKIDGKFPSHDYKPGDTIPIDFTIAPRIIDTVKKANPKVHLFGYKLLSGVNYCELVRAAYGVLLESKAVTVFANDAEDLMQKYAITKERGVHPIHNDGVMQWILDRMYEEYYKTLTAKTDNVHEDFLKHKDFLNTLLCSYRNNFIHTDEGFVFGSGAMRWEEEAFVTTARGKNEIEDYAFVNHVDHRDKQVFCGTTKKASLNAPLFHWIFKRYPSVKQILHFHHQRNDLETLEYATPGTDMDSRRDEANGPSFNIEGHGCILSYDKNGELLK